METELNAVFRDFEVGDADDAVTKKKSPYPMSNESKFNFSKTKLCPHFIDKVQLPQGQSHFDEAVYYFTTKFPDIPGSHFTDFGSMEG